MTAYVSNIFLDLDGQEVEVVSLNATTRTGRKLVKTMNRTGRAKGYSKGIAEYDLKVTVAVPEGDEPDWDNITDSRITITPDMPGKKRTSYLGCFSIEVGESYSVDNELRRDISMGALRKVEE
ncbi:hypothetical protein [Pseudogulbenkiania ferrooxidans]|uniref:Phage tail protein n=1 Tax=Pseudogulbenkiania ferrooxidans 2002 TaxID=279714 RepID=B9Z302_9NEIS|nr:hypothetical protein [Pseudogulbenkiania ferrooxidans]EEG08955.1 conserved hypothetical protein [Pseudogulbenkiania ferrooxidans 2002]